MGRELTPRGRDRHDHGDQRGLKLPPAVAPHQVVVIPIGGDDAAVAEAGAALACSLRDAGLRVKVDDRNHVRPGAKFFEWELKGAPLRVELGARDIERGEATLAARDTGEREHVPMTGVADRAAEILAAMQRSLFDDARAFRDAHMRRIDRRDEMVEFLAAGAGFAVTAWCGSAGCEEEIKTATSATIRCLTLEPEDPGGPCAVCGGPGRELATWGQAY